MPQPQGFQFALVSDGDTTGKEWRELARRAEDLGYDALLVSDHVDQRMAPLPAAAAAAEVTSDLVVGTYVLNNDLRHPLMLARDAASVHALSGGRFQLGLGAGWYRADYERTGIGFASGRVRYERLREAVGICRSHLSGREITAGEHYGVRQEAQEPPSGHGSPRLLLGGTRRGMLALAAQEADIVSVVPALGPDGPADLDGCSPARLDGTVAWIHARAAARGRSPRLNHLVWECFVTPRPAAVQEALARAVGRTPGEVRELACFLVGSADQVRDTLLARRERWGFDYVTVPAAAAVPLAPVVAGLQGR
ncbi:TIGR03621 family F420-dependent LLM class oxidoreductase [Streptomyces genisteinicus]|uniref:TIGR03621 family F420-dependent LLM class oxidoreductase n=1 Tax=Streptomyces genisteinicus TaxID=2768068 RepID=A0A7H0I1F6_9ACTN|nr:TIGR03621 family F420-dependent LLM class oxidoreductase [Streptomyces genisteinicus]QNP66622.1 TIGR03621 family F420-dependent LLM class oxidoreductase [Streptomyces genisteinicus]